MKGRETISNQQIKNLLITTAIGVGILSLPSQLALVLNNDGWLALIVGVLLIILILFLIDRVYRLYPNNSFYKIGIEVYGKVVFNILAIISAVYFIMLAAYTSRVFGEVVKAYLLEITPIEVIILTMLLATAYLSRAELQVLARTASMVYPILLGLIIFLVVISIPASDPTNMLPVFNSDLKRLPKGLLAGLVSYAGYEVVFMMHPYSDDKDNVFKYSIRGLLIVAGIYIIAFAMCLSLFGIDQLKRELWPTVSLANQVDLPGYFLENLEGIILALWVVVVYSTLGPEIFYASRILARVFDTKSHDFFVLLIIPIIYIIAMLPTNVIQVYEIMGNITSYFSLVAGVFIPVFVFIGAWVKKRRSKA